MSERTGMSHEEAARKAGKAAVKVNGVKARAKSLANRAERKAGRDAANAEAAKPPAPLPAWLTGDTRALPKRPPGKP